MKTISLSNQEAAILASMVNDALKNLEADKDSDFSESESYAHRVKLLHRRILSL
jgi:hypothetical protein